MKPLQHIFRYILLLAVGVVPIYFLEMENVDKHTLIIGWTVGATLAFIIGNLLIRKKGGEKGKR